MKNETDPADIIINDMLNIWNWFFALIYGISGPLLITTINQQQKKYLIYTLNEKYLIK